MLRCEPEPWSWLPMILSLDPQQYDTSWVLLQGRVTVRFEYGGLPARWDYNLYRNKQTNLWWQFLFQKIHFAGSKGFWGTFNCLKSQKFLAEARFPNQNKHLLGNNWCQNIRRCFTINVTLNSIFNCPKSKKSSLARDFFVKITFKMVLLASNALSKVKKIQIYGDKFLFQNIYLAGSKGFWGTLNCLKSQKILAGARFPNKNKHLLVWLFIYLGFLYRHFWHLGKLGF